MLSTLRSSACAHSAPNNPVKAPITATGLSPQRVVRKQPRCPAERVFELTGNRPVVFGGGDQHDVGGRDRGSQRDHRLGRIDILVVRRDLGKAFEDL